MVGLGLFVRLIYTAANTIVTVVVDMGARESLKSFESWKFYNFGTTYAHFEELCKCPKSQLLRVKQGNLLLE
jgi:hypothetical protein